VSDQGSNRREHLEIRSGQARLTAVRQGAGGAPHVVFLHAGIADHRSWLSVLDLLSPDMDVVAYDRRRFGTTSYVPEPHDQVADLCAVLDGLGLDEVVLVGNSQGGRIALDAALIHPTRVTSLVLVAPAVSGSRGIEPSEVLPVEEAVWQTLEQAEAVDDLVALNRAEIHFWVDGPTSPEGRVEGAMRDLALDMNRLALQSEEPGVEAEPPDTWNRLSEIACPALVVVGTLDLSPMQVRSRELAGRLPAARLQVMPGTAHMPALERPEEFAALMRQFVTGG